METSSFVLGFKYSDKTAVYQSCMMSKNACATLTLERLDFGSSKLWYEN